MTVYMTDAFRQQFLKIGVNADFFIECFAEFKGKPLNHDDIFGWDTTYKTPEINGWQYVLRHVHLRPTNAEQRVEWDRLAREKKHKTSDRALVYVAHANGNSLLIGILEEPEAHEVARMLTREHKEIMKKFAVIAEEFVRTGKSSY